MATNRNSDFRPEVDPITIALTQSRFVDAIRLAKSRYAKAATAENLSVYRNALLAAIDAQNRSQSLRDGFVFLSEAEAMPGVDADWLRKLALRYVAFHALNKAMQLAEQIGDPTFRTELVQAAVDTAFTRGQPGGSESIPKELLPQWEILLRALPLAEAGDDEGLTAALQPIGLSSPFLEWKVFLRGLAAFNRKDDVKALANFAKLNPKRLPAALASVLRYRLDRAYADALAPETAAKLRARSELLFPAPEASKHLRAMAQSLYGKGSLKAAFKHLSAIIDDLKKSHPDLMPRLAAIFYFAILDHGTPDDLNRYQSIFPPPPDDPNYDSLLARIHENRGSETEAHAHWQRYQKWIADHPQRWPGEQANLARAMILTRMAENAAQAAEPQEESDDFFNPRAGGQPLLLKPDCETCLHEAIKLAPTWGKAAHQLFAYYADRKNYAQAKAVAEQFLAKQPNNQRMLMQLGAMLIETAQPRAAAAVLERAVKANPLDSNLRLMFGASLFSTARELIVEGAFDRATENLRRATDLLPAKAEAMIRAVELLLAVLRKEIPVTDPLELRTKLQRREEERLMLTYLLVVETGLLKVPSKIRSPLVKEFNSLLAKKPATAEVLPLYALSVHYGKMRIAYHGRKTHEESIRKLAEATGNSEKISDSDMLAFGMMYLDSQHWKPLHRLIRTAETQRRTHPGFDWLQLRLMLHAGGDAERLASPFAIAYQFERLEQRLKDYRGEDRLAWQARLDEVRKDIPEIPDFFFNGSPADE